jgi:hypothetical protein
VSPRCGGPQGLPVPPAVRPPGGRAVTTSGRTVRGRTASRGQAVTEPRRTGQGVPPGHVPPPHRLEALPPVTGERPHLHRPLRAHRPAPVGPVLACRPAAPGCDGPRTIRSGSWSCGVPPGRPGRWAACRAGPVARVRRRRGCSGPGGRAARPRDGGCRWFEPAGTEAFGGGQPGQGRPQVSDGACARACPVGLPVRQRRAPVRRPRQPLSRGVVPVRFLPG